MSAETHVVTVTLGFGPNFFEVHEVFRGDETECRYLSTTITGVSHDTRALQSVMVNWGSIEDWEQRVANVQRYPLLRGAADDTD